MGTVHLSAEELSALLDGELAPQEELRSRQHLSDCASCSAEYAFAVRLEGELREAPALDCAQVLELLSASLDNEAIAGERDAAQRHLAECTDCRDAVQSWTEVTSAIKALPLVAPSARVDTAIYELTRTRHLPRPTPVRGIAARALIAVTAVLAIIVSSLGTGGAPPTTALLPSPTTERAIVASMQQIVFNQRNNTLYVLDVAAAAVDARVAGTNFIKARIPIGGAPTALALNEAANRVLVLDATQKRVTEIDAESNTVLEATTVAVSGTPTSISVDPSTNNIVVTTVAPNAPAPGAAVGAVAVINSSTKQVEAVRDMNVAPRLVVPDPQRVRTALVSPEVTKLVDGSYNVIATLPGGVSAAFSRKADNLAILSPSGSDAVVSFTGPGAPLALRLSGVPRAMIALPDGGFLVLADVGGRGQVSKILFDGTVAASVEISLTAGDLVYDDTTDRFTVASSGAVLTAAMPAQVAAVQSPAASQPPSVTASASPSAEPPSASPLATAQPSVLPTIGPNVLGRARQLSAGLYALDLPGGIQPQFVAQNGSRLWILDQSNNVSAFDMNTGDVFEIGPLRTGAHVSYWVSGGAYVFGVDASTGEINVVNVARERVEGGFATNVLSPVSAVTVGLDGRLWIGLRSAPYVLLFDPRTQRMDSLDLGAIRVSALTVDPEGRLFYADDSRGTVGTFDPRTSRLNEVPFARAGKTTALMVDSTSTLWVGTSAGEAYSVRGGVAKLTVSLQRPVTSFAADQTGRAWYLAQLPNGLTGFAYAPADGRQAPKSVAGPAQSLSFSAIGRAFLADPRGAFYMSIEGGR